MAKKLTDKQMGAVQFYCDEDNKKTFLNKHASYEASYQCDYPGWKNESNKLWKNPEVQKQIKKLMHKVAYDNYFIRNEYLAMYNMAKADGNVSAGLKALDSMAKTEAMFDNKKTQDGDAEKVLNSVAEATKETLAKIQASKNNSKKQTEILEYKESV